MIETVPPAIESMNSDVDVIEVDPRKRGSATRMLKRVVQFAFFVLCLPRLLICRLNSLLSAERALLLASESIARVPGMRGVYLRQAFYRWTLAHCGQDIYFGWLSVFSMREARVGDRVYIGRYCSIGFADIGEEVMLADGVQILSGGQEHGRAEEDQISMQSQKQTFKRVKIGRGAWIGAGAIVMADVGEGAVVGAGAVVNKPIPPHCVAVGVPARVVRHGASLAPSPTSEATPAITRGPATSESN